MKKLSSSAMMGLVFILILAGCSNNAIKIDQYTWSMTTIQSTAADGQAIAYGTDENGTLETAAFVQLGCRAANGALTLTDSTNNQTYTGSYKITGTNPDSAIYDVKIGNTNGKAASALTTYSDGKSQPTLIITLGDYTLHFFSK